MCGLFASRSKDTLKELAKQNRYRGEYSSSVATVKSNRLEGVKRKLGSFSFDLNHGDYYIGHIQAPTGRYDGLLSSHPSVITSSGITSHLWHNGIIKEHWCDHFRKENNISEEWDTQLLHTHILSNDNIASSLSAVNGSFACILISITDDGLIKDFLVFRNEIAPLFWSEDLSFSSVKVPGLSSLPPNQIMSFNLETSSYTVRDRFTTFENPYYGLTT